MYLSQIIMVGNDLSRLFMFVSAHAKIEKTLKKNRTMMTKRDNEIYEAARIFSERRDNRMSFGCGAVWADNHPNAIDFAYLQNWYQDSVDETKEPMWTDKHLEELFNDFYLIPKK